MEEIFKKSTMCFTDESEYKNFKDRCLQRSKCFCGWEIIKEYDLIGFNEKHKKKKDLNLK